MAGRSKVSEGKEHVEEKYRPTSTAIGQECSQTSPGGGQREKELFSRGYLKGKRRNPRQVGTFNGERVRCG